MPDQQQEEQWRKADDEVRKNLPSGVKLVRTLRGHANLIGRIAWSPDGRMLASPSYDKTIRLWNTDTGECLHTLRGHDSMVSCAAFDPASRFLASGSEDNTVKFWEPNNGKLLRVIEENNKSIYSVALDPAGSILASGGVAGSIKLWEPINLRLLRTLEGHQGPVFSVAFDPSGDTLASGSHDRTIKLWKLDSGKLLRTLQGHEDWVYNVVFDSKGLKLASASTDRTIKIWSSIDGRLLRTLEVHRGFVRCVIFLAEGQIIASKGSDDAIRLSNTETGDCLAAISELASTTRLTGLACHPRLPFLATVGSDPGTPEKERDRVIHIYELDYDLLLSQPAAPAVKYTSAKIVLVGESGVGKTGLGWRLAHNEFKEHASTHGQQFWLLDALCKQRKDGARCEAILWDLAGQPDYRLIHALFLDDADLALILFDPTHHNDPLGGVEFWLKHLKTARKDGAETSVVLVAARSDRGKPRLTQEELEAFCRQHGIKRYLSTSAMKGEGVKELIEGMQELIPWDHKPETVTSDTFKRIKDFVLGLKEEFREQKVILTPAELRRRLEESDPDWKFTDAEMLTAVGHLANHGFVAKLSASRGEPRLLLTPELLNNLAASFVLEARGNKKGLGSLEEGPLLSGVFQFSELAKLAAEEKDMLIDSAVVLFLTHNVCLRETDPLNGRAYLVFPELINLKKPTDAKDGPMEDGPAYAVTGSVENVYASLVALMGYTDTFTRTNQWKNQARYEVGQDGFVCGFRQGEKDERGGELDFTLYFGMNTPAPIRTLFQGLFESFLGRRNLTVLRFEPVGCANGHVINRETVRELIAEGAPSAFCSRCGLPVTLPKADQPIHLTKHQSEKVAADRRTADHRSRFEQALFRLKTHVTEQKTKLPQCFISYAWGNPDHEHWVEHSLAKDLQKAGIDVLLDKWHNRKIGSSIARFVSQIEKCDHLLVVGTPLYRQKTDNDLPEKGNIAAAQWDLAGIRMITTEAAKQTVLPVLLAGDESEAFPAPLRGRVYADFRDSERYFDTALELLLNLYEIDLANAVARELREVVDGDKARK